MPATSSVVYRRKPLYYTCPESTLYDSSEDVRDDWDGGGSGESRGGGTRQGSREEEEEEEEKQKSARMQASEVEASERTSSPAAHPIQPSLASVTSDFLRDYSTVLAGKSSILHDVLDSFDTPSRRPRSVRHSHSDRRFLSLELATLASGLVEHIVARRAELLPKVVGEHGASADGLCCPICAGVLRYPVTATCGHTFCRQCCFGHSKCTVCGQRFPALTATQTTASVGAWSSTSSSATVTSSSGSASSSAGSLVPAGLVGSGVGQRSPGFEQDILIRRLVERWWGPELKAAELQEEAQRHLDANSLDEALRCCNQSLEHAPNSAKGLQLRSEVLCRLKHYQSALADADSALKCHPTSHKAFYSRALSLSALGKHEEAIVARCISIFLDRQSPAVSNGMKAELMQDLHRLLVEPLSSHGERTSFYAGHLSPPDDEEPDEEPDDPLGSIFDNSYDLIAGCRKRRHWRELLAPQKRKAKKHFLTLRQSDFDEDHSEFGAAEDLLLGYLDDPFSEESLLEPARTRHHRQHRSHHRRRWKSGGSIILRRHPLQEQDQDNQDSGQQREQREQQEQRARHLQDHRYHQPQDVDGTLGIPRRLRALLERVDGELKAVRWLDTTPVRLAVNPALVEPSDFDCVLCCRTLWRPVVTPCGHTYCWVCLDRCMDYSSSCPLCMAPLVEQFRQHLQAGPSLGPSPGSTPSSAPAPPLNLISLAKRKMTRFVDLAMRRFIPEAYERRQQQEQDREPAVPVFICTTAFPSVPCPLFVYEQRYRLMVRRAIESGERQFGIALSTQNSAQRYVEYGTMLDIRDCVQLGDGCSILSTVGGRRFRVLARHEKDGYDTANVEFFEDERIGASSAPGDETEARQLVRDLHEKVLLKAIEWHQSLPEGIRCEIFKSFGKMPDLEENWEDVADGPAWAWWIIAILPLNDKLKVDILSTTSLEKRLRAIDKTLNLESAQQKRQRSVCVMAAAGSTAACCEGLTPSQQCQAIDCCLRERTTSSVHNHHHHHHHHEGDRQGDSNQHHHLHHHHHHHHHHLSSSADEFLL